MALLVAAVVTILDAPRTYRNGQGPGWFFKLDHYDRGDVCFGRDRHIRIELEEFEDLLRWEHDEPQRSRALKRVALLEEMLEPSC